MIKQRLKLVRSFLKEQGFDGFVQSHEDEYLNEFVPARAERLAWLTGFTGSAGTAAVLRNRAALFVDGRYTIQAASQVEPGTYDVVNVGDCTPSAWLADHVAEGARIGYDPRLFSVSAGERLARAVDGAGGSLLPVPSNPVDDNWRDRPPAPSGRIVPHPARFAGEAGGDKRRRIADALQQAGADAVVLTAPESVAWLLNIRGADLRYAPVALAAAVLRNDGAASLFARPDAVSKDLLAHLGDGVSVRPEAELEDALGALGSERAVVQVDPASTPVRIHSILEDAGATVRRADDPVELPKAIKNATELQGMRDVHETDGVALAKFLCWLDASAPGGTVSECGAADQLETFRRAGPGYRSPSFPTISGSGPNGAIVHYRATPETDRALRPGDLYLVDSGGQYPGGTTDVTRTAPVGEPRPEMRDRFTRVLKGHIAIATARFPRGTPGGQLDILARAPLWRAGLTYDHGTGHGVGSFLNVHEGPHSISFRVARGRPPAVSRGALVPLEPGMVVSNEPGYYRENEYGIRIESLVAVREEPAPEGAEIELLGFETLTLAPIDRRLVRPDLLDGPEVRWLDGYHRRVLTALAPRLDPATAAWLEAACAPLAT